MDNCLNSINLAPMLPTSIDEYPKPEKIKKKAKKNNDSFQTVQKGLTIPLLITEESQGSRNFFSHSRMSRLGISAENPFGSFNNLQTGLTQTLSSLDLTKSEGSLRLRDESHKKAKKKSNLKNKLKSELNDEEYISDDANTAESDYKVIKKRKKSVSIDPFSTIQVSSRKSSAIISDQGSVKLDMNQLKEEATTIKGLSLDKSMGIARTLELREGEEEYIIDKLLKSIEETTHTLHGKTQKKTFRTRLGFRDSPTNPNFLESGDSTTLDKADIVTEKLQRIKSSLHNLNCLLKQKFSLWEELHVLEKIGEGLQGEVFRVFDPRQRNFYAKKVIAIKDKMVEIDVLKEIQLMTEIIKTNSPALLKIYSIEYEPRTSCSIIMEYGRGDLQSFNDFRQKTNQPWKENELYIILDQLYNQIISLDELNIYHRDIKPQNVIITEDWSFKLGDFSLSELTEIKGMQLALPCGTPPFWAPEIEAGFKEKKKVACDLFGADMYSLATTIEALQSWQTEQHIGVSIRLEEIKKTRHYETEVDYDGEDLSDEWNSYSHDFKSYLIKNICTRLNHQERINLIMELSDLFILNECKEWINEELTRADSEGEESQSFKVAIFNELGWLNMKDGRYTEALELYENALKLHLSLIKEEDLQLACCYKNIGTAYANQGIQKEALDYFNKSLEIELRFGGERGSEVSNSLCNIARIYGEQGVYDSALEYYLKAIEIQKECHGEFSRVVSSSYSNIGMVFYKKGDYGESLKYMDCALRIQIQLLGENHPHVAASYNNIGIVYAEQDCFKEAYDCYYKALRIEIKVFGDNHPTVASSYSNIGLTMSEMKDYKQATEYLRAALMMGQNLLGGDNPTVATMYHNLGTVLYYQGIFKEALENFNKSLVIRQNFYGKDHFDIASSYKSLGNLYCDMEKYYPAIQNYEKALIIYKILLANNSKIEVESKSDDVKEEEILNDNFRKKSDTNLEELDYLESAMNYCRVMIKTGLTA